MQTVERYHDISCGHRVVGHESKCRFLHGHNYRIHFTCSAEGLDLLGRVIDFGEIKSRLCEWLEMNWDHRMLIWNQDKMLPALLAISACSICQVPFNPTAENMARHLVEVVGPDALRGTDITLTSVRIEETRKCSATYNITQQ